MHDSTYLAVPVIYVTYKLTGSTHLFGTNQHDRLYIDEQGKLQYINIQCMEGTKFGEYEFAVDLMGRNPVTNRYPEDAYQYKEIPDDEIYELSVKEPLDYARWQYHERILELDQRMDIYD